VVDRTLILRKLSQLDEYLGQVSEYSGVTLKAYKRAVLNILKDRPCSR